MVQLCKISLALAAAGTVAVGCRTQPGDPRGVDSAVADSGVRRDSLTRDSAAASTTVDRTVAARTDTSMATRTDTAATSMRDTSMTRRTGVTRDSASGDVARGMGTMPDAQAARIVNTIDRGEIEAARLAVDKARSSEVRSFAQSMIEQHTAALSMRDSLGRRMNWPMDSAAASSDSGTRAMSRDSAMRRTTSDTAMRAAHDTAAHAAMMQPGQDAMAIVAQLQASHRTMMERLRGTSSGTAFDRAYVDGQVEDHQKALGMVKQLASGAQDSAFRQHLTTLATAIEQHLERARNLQRTITSE